MCIPTNIGDIIRILEALPHRRHLGVLWSPRQACMVQVDKQEVLEYSGLVLLCCRRVPESPQNYVLSSLSWCPYHLVGQLLLLVAC